MPVLDFDGMDGTGLATICEQRWRESAMLDFKRTLPRKDDRGRSEFLKDICAFANADGGDLIFGIDEDEGAAKELAPIVEEGSEVAALRLGQMLDSGVEPRLRGVRFRPIPLEGGGYAMVVRVPASFDGPHRFTVNGVSRFVARSGTHTSDLTYQQLRMAFDRTASLIERAREFRADRLRAILDGRGWATMRPGPLCVVHILPMAAMDGRSDVDIVALYNDHSKLSFSDWGGASRAINLDGAISYVKTSDGTMAYTLVFRSGAIEAVRFAGLTIEPKPVIPSLTLSCFLRDALGKFATQCRDMGVGGPGIVGVALLSVRGFEFGLADRTVATADREHLVLPETWIENLESIADIDTVARPVLNTLWQAYGQPECDLYDERGNWNPRN